MYICKIIYSSNMYIYIYIYIYVNKIYPISLYLSNNWVIIINIYNEVHYRVLEVIQLITVVSIESQSPN